MTIMQSTHPTPTTCLVRPTGDGAVRAYGIGTGAAHTTVFSPTGFHTGWFHKAITTHRRPEEDALH